MSQKASDFSCVPMTRAEHQEYHRILHDRGFTCEVRATLRVGRKYEHPTKPVVVWIEEGDAYLMPKVFYRGEVQTDREYSVKEWEWLSRQPSTPEGERETLRRELHVLLDIRPRVMTHAEIEHKTKEAESDR